MLQPLRLLLIEDSDDDATLVVRELTRAGYEVVASRVDTAAKLSHALERGGRWDLVISDSTMPRFSGMAALDVVRQHDASTPFIFVSGTLAEESAVAALRSGAQDYFVKGQLQELAPAVQRALEQARARDAQEVATAAHRACHDPLTDLPDRALFFDRLEQAMLASSRTGSPLAVAVLDLDGFTSMNDSLGRGACDHILQQVAARLCSALRKVDTVARIGADEFAFVLPDTDHEGAARSVHKVIEALHAPFVLVGRRLVVTGTCGIACLSKHVVGAEALLRQAETATELAKTSHLGCAIYTDEGECQPGPGSTGSQDGLLTCEYEPIVSLYSESVFAVEARARWQQPPAWAPPGADSGSFDAALRGRPSELTTMWVLDHVLAEEWPQPMPGGAITLAVSLYPESLGVADLPDRIAESLTLYGVDASALMAQISGPALASTTRSLTCLDRLHRMGVKIALDDFGTHGSSLEHLRRLPVDVLKIDASLVAELENGDAPIVRAIIDLGHDLGLTVVAKGVESPRVQERLNDLLCDAVQGGVFGSPSSAAKTQRWIAKYATPSDESHNSTSSKH